MYEYEAKVLRVIDGDSVEVMVSLGFNLYNKVKVRMVGIDAPELRTKKGKEVKKWLQDQIEGKEIFLKSEGLGKYGRCLGTIRINDVNINELMLEEGLAKPYSKLL